jgi:hypothetical protein
MDIVLAVAPRTSGSLKIIDAFRSMVTMIANFQHAPDAQMDVPHANP